MVTLKKNSQKSFTLVLLTLICSCTAKYGVAIGGHSTKLSQIITTKESFEDEQNIDKAKFSGNTTAAHVGISEEFKNTITKFNFYSQDYEDVNYTIQTLSNTHNIQVLSETGFWATLAYKLRWFHPHISVSYFNIETLADEIKKTTYLQSALGLGAEIEIPISESSFIYLGYNRDYTINTKRPDLDSITLFKEEANHERVYLGLRFNFTEGKAAE